MFLVLSHGLNDKFRKCDFLFGCKLGSVNSSNVRRNSEIQTLFVRRSYFQVGFYMKTELKNQHSDIMKREFCGIWGL